MSGAYPVRLVTILLGLGLAIGFAPAAMACGYTVTRHASVHGRGHRSALVIGDSTGIFAVPKLAARGMSADAKECRQWNEGLALIRGRAHLPHLVVFALGANGPVSDGQIYSALHAIGPDRILGLVTPRNLSSSADAMRRVAARRPRRVLLIDWRSYSAGDSGWFAGDGLHVDDAGASAFARLIKARSLGVIAPPQLPRLAHVTPRRRCGHGVVVLRGHASCRAARAVVRRPPLSIGLRSKWHWFDWRPTHWGPWRSIYRRGRWIVANT